MGLAEAGQPGAGAAVGGGPGGDRGGGRQRVRALGDRLGRALGEARGEGPGVGAVQGVTGGQGVDDLGGVSPITADHINPDYAWPALRELEDIAEFGGVPLGERLPTHARYVEDGWLSPAIQRAIEADDAAGERYRAVLDG